MKREILFVTLCIGLLSISTVLYANFIQTTHTSILSDQEMELITGKCSCYEYDWEVCRWYGDLECTSGSSCPPSYSNYTDNGIPRTVEYGPINGKTTYFSGMVDCYQPYSVSSAGTQDDYICETSAPPDYNYKNWASWFYYCRNCVAETCKKCSWNEPIDEMVDLAGFNCH
jgi:hypothetical protein